MPRPQSPPTTLTTSIQFPRLALCLLQLFLANGLFLPAQADTLLPRPEEWEEDVPFMQSLGHDEEEEEEEEVEENEEGDWVVEEESVVFPPSLSKHRIPPLGETRRPTSDIWWQVLTPEDPAMGAEPARWDGWLTLHHPQHTPLPPPRLPTDYEVMQDTWIEDAVT